MPHWIRGLWVVVSWLVSNSLWLVWWIGLAPLAWGHFWLSALGGDQEARRLCDRDPTFTVVAGLYCVLWLVIAAWAIGWIAPPHRG